MKRLISCVSDDKCRANDTRKEKLAQPQTATPTLTSATPPKTWTNINTNSSKKNKQNVSSIYGPIVDVAVVVVVVAVVAAAIVVVAVVVAAIVVVVVIVAVIVVAVIVVVVAVVAVVVLSIFLLSPRNSHRIFFPFSSENRERKSSSGFIS